MPTGDLLPQEPERPAPTCDATPGPARPPRQRNKSGYVKRLPFFCRCPKARYRSEDEAIAGAAAASASLGVPFTVYRCPRAQCWHKTTSGFHYRQLLTAGRLVAYHVHARGAVDRHWLTQELLKDPAKTERGVRKAIKELVDLALVVVDEKDARLLRIGNAAGLVRVMQAGVDGWRQQIAEQD